MPRNVQAIPALGRFIHRGVLVGKDLCRELVFSWGDGELFNGIATIYQDGTAYPNSHYMFIERSFQPYRMAGRSLGEEGKRGKLTYVSYRYATDDDIADFLRLWADGPEKFCKWLYCVVNSSLIRVEEQKRIARIAMPFLEAMKE